MAKKNTSLNHNEDIIASLAGAAISDIAGIAPQAGSHEGHFQIYMSGDKVFVDVNINAAFGYSVPELAYNIQTKIKKDIERRTKYTVEKVNVNIISVIMPI
ncbi:MAG: Asp23/Gls24 family envelope stress response protein [Clostridiales bacterium]|jgi:uncharacterized alkaline shock family protein YloU|nr:Asp23/Gls24 family envelope stress response protein [Clostridiales bacterium]